MIKIAIVGTGGIAHWHAKSYQNIDNVKIVAACDINANVLKNFVINIILRKNTLPLKN